MSKLTETKISKIIKEELNSFLLDVITEVYTDAKIRKAVQEDYWQICELTSKIEGAESPQIIDTWLQEEGGMNMSMSFVAENSVGEMIGVCVCSNGKIDEETPDMKEVQPELYKRLSRLQYVMGLGFFIEKEYRGGGLNRNMMASVLTNARQYNYDFVIIPVYRHLKTHNMYMHAGCIPFHISNEDVIYYLYPINSNVANIVKQYTTIDEIKNQLL